MIAPPRKTVGSGRDPRRPRAGRSRADSTHSKRRVPSWLVASMVGMGLATAEGAARADAPDKRRDGVYGRFDGDLDLSLSAGVAASSGAPSGALLARAFYLETAGVYLAYSDAFGSSNATPPRSFGFGVALRPLFIPRWGLDFERGPALVDLMVDAITFDFGALWPADTRGHFNERPGIEVGLGTEVPLTQRAAGPWIGLRGALRWRGWQLAGSEPMQAQLSPAIFITLAWHVIVNAHLTDAGDRIFR